MLTYKNKKLTPKEKMEIMELKAKMLAKQSYRCYVCGELLRAGQAQMAHIIPKHKNLIEKYGYEVIHHEMNMRITCADCNSSVMRGVNRDEFAKKIEKIICHGGK